MARLITDCQCPLLKDTCIGHKCAWARGNLKETDATTECAVFAIGGWLSRLVENEEKLSNG